MNHLAILEAADRRPINGKDVQRRAAGRFYTHEAIGRRLAKVAADALRSREEVSVLDPFGGDGRLVAWLLPELAKRDVKRIRATVWEHDATAGERAAEVVAEAARDVETAVRVDVWTGDTFERAATTRERFDLVVTNPPWELLKPDRRELLRLPHGIRDQYVAQLRVFDQRLASAFPLSQPSRRFGGWGTNLSRVGAEVALRLTGDDGVCGLVCPTSLLADGTSGALREWMLGEFALVDVTHWPAEARLFKDVDVPCVSMVAARGERQRGTRVTRIGASRDVLDSEVVQLDREWLESRDFVIPVHFGAKGMHMLRSFDHHPPLSALEGRHESGLWAGRELDETGRAQFTLPAGKHAFVRSRHIHRLARPSVPPDEFVDVAKREPPASTRHTRLAWRDISRPTQARRVHATLLPPGPVTGNSVSVAHFRDGDVERLWALLGLVSSLPFEFQARSMLMTNHLSLSVMRAVRLPALTREATSVLAEATRDCLAGKPGAEARLEQVAACTYGLGYQDWSRLVACFALSDGELSRLEEGWSR